MIGCTSLMLLEPGWYVSSFEIYLESISGGKTAWWIKMPCPDEGRFYRAPIIGCKRWISYYKK